LSQINPINFQNDEALEVSAALN